MTSSHSPAVISKILLTKRDLLCPKIWRESLWIDEIPNCSREWKTSLRARKMYAEDTKDPETNRIYFKPCLFCWGEWSISPKPDKQRRFHFSISRMHPTFVFWKSCYLPYRRAKFVYFVKDFVHLHVYLYDEFWSKTHFILLFSYSRVRRCT